MTDRLVEYTPLGETAPRTLAPWYMLETGVSGTGTAITLTVADPGNPGQFATVHATEDQETINARWLAAETVSEEPREQAA